MVIDKSKVRRERSKTRKIITERQNRENTAVRALYFDGRKDSTLVQEKERNGKFHPRVQREEHISIIQEPGSRYFGHVTPKCGDAEGVAASIWDYVLKRGIDVSLITCIGSDGEATNTGKHNGVIRRLEEYLRRPVQWTICQLHANELPLRRLLQLLDGKTTGPSSFAGQLGKSLLTCDNRPIVVFEAIDSYIPNIDVTELSVDQKYLKRACEAVISGYCPADLAAMLPGPVNHARWLTTACRILREYMSCKSPSEALQTLAKFVVCVYAPMWFQIKGHHRIVDAPNNLFSMIQRMRYLPEEIKAELNANIQRNGFWAHPECLITAMLANETVEIRKRAAFLIIEARQKQLTSKRNRIRKFSPPVINFEATNFAELIFWEQSKLTEPPVTKNLTDEDLKKISEGDIKPLEVLQEYFNLPCHSQAVERCVKEVTAASYAVYGESSRDGFIRTRLLDRKIMPRFETKGDFRSQIN